MGPDDPSPSAAAATDVHPERIRSQSMHRLLGYAAIVLLPGLALTVVASPAHAQLELTDYADANGFTLEDFVLNTPTFAGVGPLGFALRTDGQVLVTAVNGDIRRFPSHANLQDWSDGTLVSSRGQSNALAIAQVQVGNGWKYYLSQDILGRIVEIDEDGQDVVPAHVFNLPGALCVIPYPPAIVNSHTGHLFATAENSADIVEIDPAVGIITPHFLINAGSGLDGLCFSPDGSVLYVAAYSNQVVKGFDVTTKALVFTSPVTVPALHPDGIAIGTGTLTGFLYVNCTDGTVWEFGLPGSPHAGEANLIAENGTRGDFIASDPNVYCGFVGHPSLLLTQSDSMVRLDPPGGGFFGPPTSNTALVTCGTEIATTNTFNGDGVNEDLLSAPAIVMGGSWSVTVTSVNSHGPGGPLALTIRASTVNGPTFTSPFGGRQSEFLIGGTVYAKYTGSNNGITGNITTGPVPTSCSLLGLPWAAQATIVGGGFGDLTNAVHGVIGTE